MIGSRLSHFRITAKLGEGGMGEVYRAEDTKLGREVAIKVLPEAVARDPERLARFEREAQVLASLNHPHIAAIHQVEVADGQPFLVMELAEGEDLKGRLERGPIPMDEALAIALQIAEALEAAHERGVVHRDLKPANVKVTPDGEVKVLDFGLAKALDTTTGDTGEGSANPAVIHLSMSPTLTQQMTGAGVILGTAAYMAPEQARGKSVDKKADVWAFGVLLWEMLTADQLFGGETVTDVLAAVVTREPDVAALPKSTPRAIRRLLARCLRKDPRRRLPDIGAARLELEEVLEGGTAMIDAPDSDLTKVIEAQRRGRIRERLAWALALVAAGLAGFLLPTHRQEAPASAPTVRFAIDPPEGWSYIPEWDWPVPSPDGQRVVFSVRATGHVAADGADTMLWIRSLDSATARPIVGTEGTRGIPAWSPDGEFLLFETEGEVRKLRLSDGSTQRLAALPGSDAMNASWGSSGTILLSRMSSSGVLYSVAETGGEAVQLTSLDTSRGEQNHNFPQFLPDGRRFLFVVGGTTGEENAGLFLASLENPGQRQKIMDGWGRRLYAEGHVLFAREGDLYAQPFDAVQALPRGVPVTIASQVGSWSQNVNLGWFAGSEGGTVTYFSGNQASDRVQLTWFDRTGQESEPVGEPGNYGQIALSPDGRNVALERSEVEGEYDLWVMELARGVMSRVTVTPGEERDPVWSPDSRSLAFIWRAPDGSSALLSKGLRASDPETTLMASSGENIPESWSPDGETLMVVRRNAADEQSVWAQSLSTGAEPRPVLNAGFRVDEPQLSPDGRWLAYVSPESGQEEVYVEPFEREGDRLRVSLSGGGQPKWRADSRELFFVTGGGFLMAVNIDGDDDGRLEVSLPKELFEIASIEGMGYDDYAVNPDGDRFLVKVPIRDEVEQTVQVLSNWTAMLAESQ